VSGGDCEQHLPIGNTDLRLHPCFNGCYCQSFDALFRHTLSPIRSIEKSDKFYYNLSPNPTQNVLTVNGTEDYDLNLTVELWNAVGIQVYQKEVVVNKGAFEQKIEMANFAEGIYSVFLRLPNGFSVKKTVVKVK
jgi:hypothetical protein